ncbi:hypothetical protein PUN28_020736 [Cardiocondyla obscurior]|uniref:Uncharacterized protein n=1 Tax=Cardiocondyla obscurior TaxID=286306 RepID=A0AAW2E927_9HYME
MVDKVDNKKYTECIGIKGDGSKQQLHAADKKRETERRATNNCEDGKFTQLLKISSVCDNLVWTK